MDPKIHLVEKLEELASNFPHVQIKYAYNELIETHVVELTPEYEYYNNVALDDAWFPISLEFMEIFPEENISFVSSDSSLSIGKPEFEWNIRAIIDLDIMTCNFFEEINLMQLQMHDYSFPNVFFTNEESGCISLPFLNYDHVNGAIFPALAGNLEVIAGNTQNAMAA